MSNKVVKSVAACLILWGAALPVSAADDLHPFDKYKGITGAHQVVQDIDQGSFGKAVGHYPKPGGAHSVALGRYMMWKIVSLFESGDRVEGLSLDSFSQQCRESKQILNTSVICRYSSAFSLRAGGKAHRSEFSLEGDVGRYMAPTAGSYKEVVRAELREQVDLAIDRFKQDMTAAGVLKGN